MTGAAPQRPTVSVVIPTRDRPALLADTLRALSTQTIAAELEVVVVDDGTRGAAAAVVAEWPAAQFALRLVESPRPGINAARNAGAAAASAAVVCFLDDDVDLPESWAAAMLAALERDRSVGVVGGPVRLRLETEGPRRCGKEPLGEHELDLGGEERAVEAVFGGNMAVRRSVLEIAGPFDETLNWFGDEMEWQRRVASAGVEIRYAPGAWIWHVRSAADLRFTRLLRRRFRTGVGRARFMRRIGRRPSVSETLRALPGFCWHAARHRCSIGLFYAAGSLGQMCETLRADVVQLGSHARRP